MNPNVSEDEVIENISFRLTEQEYLTAMEELNEVLGGTSYYVPHYHMDFYTVYCGNALGVKLLRTKEELIERMEYYLDIIIQVKEYSQIKYLVGRDVSLTDHEISYLSTIRDKMRAAKEEQLSTADLYELYNSLFIDIDQILGGNTLFGTNYRYYMLQIGNSLEEVIPIFESIRDKEKVTNAYARYYCDYFSILAGLLPAIFGGFALIEDKRWKLHELIYPRAIHSIQYVLAKFLAISLSFMLAFYILAGVSTLLFARFGSIYHLEIDYLAFFKYTTFWVMPTVLFTTAFTMFVSVVFHNGIIPIMLQLILFFLSARTLIGDYPLWKPIIRYNEIGRIETYLDCLPDIIMNRIFITLVSCLLVIGSAKIYSFLRRGYGIHIWR
jgi:hypothetical protein